MRKVILKEKAQEITLDQLIGNELAAYRMKSDNGAYAVLAKLPNVGRPSGCEYSFVPLNSSDSSARYVGRTWKEAIENAAKCRDVRVFKDMREMISAMYNKEF